MLWSACSQKWNIVLRNKVLFFFVPKLYYFEIYQNNIFLFQTPIRITKVSENGKNATISLWSGTHLKFISIKHFRLYSWRMLSYAKLLKHPLAKILKSLILNFCSFSFQVYPENLYSFMLISDNGECVISRRISRDLSRLFLQIT